MSRWYFRIREVTIFSLHKKDKSRPLAVLSISPPRPNGLAGWLLAAQIAIGLPTGLAQGASGELTPRVSASAIYTDNLFLESADVAESELVTQINPGVQVRKQGRRAALSLDYRMQNLFYKEHNEANETRHQLGTTLKSELVNDRLFVDANASFTQRTISETGVQDPENIAPSSDVTDVANYSVSPYWQRKFGATGSALLRYSVGEVRYLEDTVTGNDALNQSLTVELTRTPSATRRSTTLYYRGRDVQYDATDNQADSRLETAGLDLRYAMTAVTTLTLGAGYESNTYSKVTADDETEGAFWKTGITWKPSRRTVLDAGIGDHFYGIAPFFSLSHETRRTNLKFAYKEDFTTSSLLQAGTPTFDPDGNPIFGNLNPGISTEVYLQKSYSLSLTQKLLTSSFTLGAQYNDRESQTSGANERRARARANWSWRRGQRTTVDLTLDGQRNNFGNGSEEYDDRNARLALNRKLQRNVDGVLSYAHLTRGASETVPGYHRNLVKAEITLSF